MILSDPPIQIELINLKDLEITKKGNNLDLKMIFIAENITDLISDILPTFIYDKTKHECIDGFPSENKP